MIAAITWSVVLLSAPVESVARVTVIALPVTLTESGEFGAPGLSCWYVTLFPSWVGSLSSWPQSQVVSTTARAACDVTPPVVLHVDGVAKPAGAAPGVPGRPVLPPLVETEHPIDAMALRR